MEIRQLKRKLSGNSGFLAEISGKRIFSGKSRTFVKTDTLQRKGKFCETHKENCRRKPTFVSSVRMQEQTWTCQYAARAIGHWNETDWKIHVCFLELWRVCKQSLTQMIRTKNYWPLPATKSPRCIISNVFRGSTSRHTIKITKHLLQRVGDAIKNLMIT